MYNPMKHSAYTYTGSLWLYIHEILWFATCLLVSKQTMFSCCVLLDVSLKLLPISTRLVVHPIQHLVYPTYLETVYIPYFFGYIYILCIFVSGLFLLVTVLPTYNALMLRQLLIRDGLGWQLVSWPLPPTRLLLFSPSFAVLSGYEDKSWMIPENWDGWLINWLEITFLIALTRLSTTYSIYQFQLDHPRHSVATWTSKWDPKGIPFVGQGPARNRGLAVAVSSALGGRVASWSGWICEFQEQNFHCIFLFFFCTFDCQIFELGVS